MAEAKTDSKSKEIDTIKPLLNQVVDVTVHPLVLLSAADHYHRVARGTRKRAVGVLLGSVSRGRVDVLNSFAVPFEEDLRNPAVFYLDHNFLDNMLHMFRKINSKERVVGFYSTGPQIRSNDLRIYSMIQRFLPEGTVTPPIFCIIDVRPGHKSIPTTAYTVVEEMEEGSGTQAEVMKSFAHVPSLIGAVEAEEIGVEHLLRDINDPTISTVANLIHAKMSALVTLKGKLEEMEDYATGLADGRIKKRNHEIVSNMQQILNLLPNLNVEELVKAILVKTNDMHMVIYLSSLIRSVIALHDLVNNKIRYNEEMDKTFGELDGNATKAASSTEEEKKEEVEKKSDESKK